MKWIKVEDQIPMPPCVVYWTDGRFTVLEDEIEITYSLEHRTYNITHWILLPQPPKD